MAEEEKKQSPQKQKDEKKEPIKEEGVAGGILKGIGKMIPGLDGLIKGLEESPTFKERLKKIDEEVEHKLKESPLKRAEEGRPSHILMGIPPGARGKVTRGRRFIKERPEAVRPEGPPPAPKERPADIFDEKDHLKIIAEIPGVDENDIKCDLQNDTLTISVDISDHKYHQELKLPCEPKGELEKSYKNGILEIKIRKNPETNNQ